MSRSSPAEELLCKAVGPALTVLDLTAGLGRDGLVLAASMPGRRVLLVERNLVLFHLLRDAIVRLRRENPDLAQRLRIELRDSARDYLEIGQDCAPELEEKVSVYLDPMYPAAHTARRTAKSGKESQFLHRLTGGATTESETTDNQLLFQVVNTMMRLYAVAHVNYLRDVMNDLDLILCDCMHARTECGPA